MKIHSLHRSNLFEKGLDVFSKLAKGSRYAAMIGWRLGCYKRFASMGQGLFVKGWSYENAFATSKQSFRKRIARF
jgi:hypothetical protein